MTNAEIKTETLNWLAELEAIEPHDAITEVKETVLTWPDDQEEAELSFEETKNGLIEILEEEGGMTF